MMYLLKKTNFNFNITYNFFNNWQLLLTKRYYLNFVAFKFTQAHDYKGYEMHIYSMNLQLGIFVWKIAMKT